MCGIIGIVGKDEVNQAIYDGLTVVQHRGQDAALDARLAQDGVRAGPEHRFVDDGQSGDTLLRPALERLRDAVATGQVDRLYVHSPARLARRYAYQVVLMEEFQRAG